jgi:hypothetical protein
MKRFLTTMFAAGAIAALPILFAGCEERNARETSPGPSTTEDRTGESTPPTTSPPPPETPPATP